VAPPIGSGAGATWTAIEGLIGAGKTTTATLVGARAEYYALFERVERHPLLPEYYSDPAKYALETELVFTALRLHEVKRQPPAAITISDFAPAKTLIFASLQLNAADLDFVTAAHRHLWRGQPQPDLVVFLDVPPEVCLARIRHRDRPFERGLDFEIMRELRTRYLEELMTLGSRVERLALTGDEPAEEVGRRATQLIERVPTER
jgi:deoxyadenosine/deoxycytidine kinase